MILFQEITFRDLLGMLEIPLSSILNMYWAGNFFSIERNFKLSELCWHWGLQNLNTETEESNNFCRSLEPIAAFVRLLYPCEILFFLAYLKIRCISCCFPVLQNLYSRSPMWDASSCFCSNAKTHLKRFKVNDTVP